MRRSLPVQESLRKWGRMPILSRAANGSAPAQVLSLSIRTETPSEGKGILSMPAVVHDIRLRNLRHLCTGVRGKQSEMARRIGMSESALSQLIGKTPTKRLGDRQARTIEKKLGLDPGWLDTENHDLTKDSSEIARQYQHLTPAQKRVVRDLLDTYRK